jgi:diguanylate cyclase (GGDEF)-like protein
MAQFTYAAAFALIRALEQANILSDWPDFLEAYGLRDPGVERPYPGFSSGYEGPPEPKRLRKLKELGKRVAEPRIQEFFEGLTSAFYTEVVDPGRDILGKKIAFGHYAKQTKPILTSLIRELESAGYRFEKGKLVSEETGPEEAEVDAITGIGSRRYLNAAAARIFDQCKAQSLPCAAVFFDIDDFKLFNTRYGYGRADVMLKAVAQAADSAVRLRGVLGRYGTGDEILAVLRNMTEDEAVGLGERMRSEIGDLKIEDLTVTVSVGVASSLGRGSIDDLWAAAERALKEAKKRGKGQTVKYSQCERIADEDISRTGGFG